MEPEPVEERADDEIAGEPAGVGSGEAGVGEPRGAIGPGAGEAGAIGPGAGEPMAAIVEQIRLADEAWARGDRAGAVRAWRALLRAGGSEGARPDAVEIMLRVRLLPVAGNLAPLWLERPLDVAMQRCADLAYAEPGAGPNTPAAWCRVAMADYDLWMPDIAGADPGRVASDLVSLAGWAPADERVAAAGAARGSEGGSGSEENPFPGTWVLGWGVAVAPGAGAGVGLHFLHPDLGFQGMRLGFDTAVDTLGGFSLAGSFSERPSHRSLVVRASGGNLRGAVWGDGNGDADEGAAYAWQTAQGAAGFSSTYGRVSFAGGGEARWDHAVVYDPPGDVPDAAGGAAVGPWASLRWAGPVDVRIAGDVNGTQAGPAFALATAGVRVAIRGREEMAGQVVGRLIGQASTDGPFFRLPSAGGSTLLRGAPAGRYRGPLLVGAQVEYRHVIYGPVKTAAFIDTAWVSTWQAEPLVDDLHLSAGAGLRLVLPPADLNTTRIDVGVVPGLDGTVTWGVVVAWGEAF